MHKACEAEQVQVQVHGIDLAPLAAPLVVPLVTPLVTPLVVPLEVDHEQVRR